MEDTLRERAVDLPVPCHRPQRHARRRSVLLRRFRHRLRRRARHLAQPTYSEPEERTVTDLDNPRPSWIQLAYERLDCAVWAAYEWLKDPTETPDGRILEGLLALDQQRSHFM
jgi:hypothetical protein